MSPFLLGNRVISFCLKLWFLTIYIFFFTIIQLKIVWNFKNHQKKNFFFEKELFKTSRNNQALSKFGHIMQYVTCNTNSNFFVKLWLRLRLPVEIRRLEGIPTFPCRWVVGLCYFTYSRPISSPLTHIKSAENMQNCCIFWGCFLRKNFFLKETNKNQKNNAHNILKTNQNHIKIHVVSNRKTCNSIKSSSCYIFESPFNNE